MKKAIFILIAASLTAFCYAQSNGSSGKIDNQTFKDLPPDSSFRSFNYISLSEAQKVLGHVARVKDSLLKFSGGLLRFQFTYKTNFKDSIKNEISTLFFGFEQYEQVALAKRNYDLIKAENAKTLNVSDFKQAGDEGFLAKDQANNPFIMIRKDKKIFKLKLRNVTGTGSLDKLEVLAKKIVSLH